MANPRHVTKPVRARRKYGYIGEPPLGTRTGVPLARAKAYLANWIQQNTLFSFSGPPDGNLNPVGNAGGGAAEEGTYYIPHWSPSKADSGKPQRCLMAVIVPWHVYAVDDGGWPDPLVEWQDVSGGGAVYTIWSKNNKIGDASSTYGDYTTADPICLYRGFDSSTPFTYTPAGAGNWGYGTLHTEHICVAALTVAAAPDTRLREEQLIVQYNDNAAGQTVRGYVSGANSKGIGDLIHLLGDGTNTHDAVEHNIRYPLWSMGHPVGVWTDAATCSSAYLDIASGGTMMNVGTLIDPDRTISAYPVVIATTTGCDASNPAWVKYTSTTGADTWELKITSSTTALYDYSDAFGGSDTLSVNLTTDKTKIELKAEGTAEIVLHSWSLWQPALW